MCRMSHSTQSNEESSTLQIFGVLRGQGCRRSVFNALARTTQRSRDITFAFMLELLEP
jgi:hypothetical protein